VSRCVAVLSLALLAILGCDSTTPTASAASIELPTYGPQGGTGCAMTDLEGWTLTGDPSDPQVAWLQSGQLRRDVLWPPGFRAVFDPTIRVFDRTGRPIVHAGAGLSGGCRVGDITYLVEPLSFD